MSSVRKHLVNSRSVNGTGVWGPECCHMHSLMHFKSLIYVHLFVSGYMQIFSTGWPQNVKKHTCKLLNDCAGEVGVRGLSVGGCVLGEGLGYNPPPVCYWLSFKSLPVFMCCVRHLSQRHTQMVVASSNPWICCENVHMYSQSVVFYSVLIKL